jgi:hypothetical protein
VKHADRAELHCSREFIAAARAGALDLCAHGPSRPSVAIRAKNTPLHRVVRYRPAQPKQTVPVPQAIAYPSIVACEGTLRNRIPPPHVLRRFVLTMTFGELQAAGPRVALFLYPICGTG